MVPRPLAPAQAMKSRTCADVFQPCPRGLFFNRATMGRARLIIYP